MSEPSQEAYTVLERLLRDDDDVVLVWYLMGWLHVLTKDRDSAHFYLEQASKVSYGVLIYIYEIMSEFCSARG